MCNRRSQLVPVWNCFLLGALEERPGRTQVFSIDQSQPVLNQAGRVGAGSFEKAPVDGPQVRRHQQTANEHRQAEKNASQ